ncbi:hypothetical protein [Thermus arciformis]
MACNTLTVTAPPPSFTLSLNPASLTVEQGSSGATTLTLTPQNGFTGTVNLSLVDGGGNPVAGVGLSPTSVSVSGASPVNQTLTLAVASSVNPGTYALKVRGTSGSLTQEVNLTLTVTAPPKGLRPSLLGRSGNAYTVGVDLVGTADFYRGAQFTVELPSGFTLSATTGELTGGCFLDYVQASSNPNRWNVALVCGSAFQGPGQLAVLTVSGTGGGTLTLSNGVLAKPDYSEESVPGGSLTLAP